MDATMREPDDIPDDEAEKVADELETMKDEMEAAEQSIDMDVTTWLAAKNHVARLAITLLAELRLAIDEYTDDCAPGDAIVVGDDRYGHSFARVQQARTDMVCGAFSRYTDVSNAVASHLCSILEGNR